jgi:hypothetical protein
MQRQKFFLGMASKCFDTSTNALKCTLHARKNARILTIMKRTFLTSILLALFLCMNPLRAADAMPPETSVPAKPAAPGVELAQALTTVTGVAISPLMGVGVVGAWKYCAAKTPQERAQLPWFAQPWFWVPALIIVGLCALKDVFGIAVPAALKKPFDILETIEHKVSGLVAAGAFVPLIASVFHSAQIAAPAGIQTAGAHGFLAAANDAWLLNFLSVPVMIVIFLVVCLASNAINILILLSPFTIIDAGLKLFRLAVLAVLTLTALINPWLGALLSLLIIAIAWLVAGWSFRLSQLGVVFIWEILTHRAARFTPEIKGNWMFLGRKTNKVPIRTYGKLFRDASGKFVFEYRPWLVLPQKLLQVPAGNFSVGKGLFYSEVVRIEGSRTRSVMLLPPRYRSHEAELAQIYGFNGVRDSGLRAAFAWLKDWIGFKPKSVPQIAAA